MRDVYSGRRPLHVFWPKAPDIMRARLALGVQAPQTPSRLKSRNVKINVAVLPMLSVAAFAPPSIFHGLTSKSIANLMLIVFFKFATVLLGFFKTSC